MSKLSENKQKRLLLFNKIKEKGGVISKEEFYELGRSIGYNTQGLGGLFVGNKQLTSIAGDRIALTPGALELIEEYQDWLESKE